MKFAIAALFCCAVSASAADVGGIWRLAYTTENGLKREAMLDLKVEGDQLSGVLSSERGKAAISKPTLKGDEIAFDLVRDARYDVITVHYNGRIEGSTMKLTMQYGKREPVAVTGKKGS